MRTTTGTPRPVPSSTVVSQLCITSTFSSKVSLSVPPHIRLCFLTRLLFSAHGGLQGTTRPTHYYVVHDEIGFKADELQGLTNAVSYMFARATKAVSLVSPAYYADLACERGRCYLHKLLQGIGAGGASASVRSGDEDQTMREAVATWHGGVAGPALKDTMFYL
jgi:hypothetical protein